MGRLDGFARLPFSVASHATPGSRLTLAQIAVPTAGDAPILLTEFLATMQSVDDTDGIICELIRQTSDGHTAAARIINLNGPGVEGASALTDGTGRTIAVGRTGTTGTEPTPASPTLANGDFVHVERGYLGQPIYRVFLKREYILEPGDRVGLVIQTTTAASEVIAGHIGFRYTGDDAGSA
jgi:hypothetical protein